MADLGANLSEHGKASEKVKPAPVDKKPVEKPKATDGA